MHPLLGKRPCTTFHGVNVAVSIQLNVWHFDPHAGQNRELHLSAQGRLPGTLQYTQLNQDTPLMLEL